MEIAQESVLKSQRRPLTGSSARGFSCGINLAAVSTICSTDVIVIPVVPEEDEGGVKGSWTGTGANRNFRLLIYLLSAAVVASIKHGSHTREYNPDAVA